MTMKLYIHPEGIAVLKGFGIAVLVLAGIVLRYSSEPWEFLFGFLSSKADQAMDSPADHLPGRRKKRAKFDREHWSKIKIAFYCLSGVLLVWLLADWLLIPEAYSVGGEWRWPLVVSVFFAGAVVILIGSKVWDERIGWAKWTFWYALLATVLVLLVFVRWMNPTEPRGFWSSLLGGCILAGLLFLWLFGMLRRLDRNKTRVASIVQQQPEPSRAESPVKAKRHRRND
jgi:cytochrome c oxidase subunit IV